MKRAAKDLEFEKAALLRDEVVELRGLMVLEQGPESLEASAEPVGTTARVVRAGGPRRRRGP
jgi:excinuclease UvrABC nuclease subunit